MTGCSVLGCRSNNNKKLRRNNGTATNNTKINYHRFPKDKRLCKLWLRQCGRKYDCNTTHAKICSEHFLADCYERNLQHELLSITPKCKKLKPKAVPTERLPPAKRLRSDQPNYLGKRICHRRNATDTNTYEDENSQPEPNQIIIRPLIVKEEMKFYNQPNLPKSVIKPIKFVFVNAGPQTLPSQQNLRSTPNIGAKTQQIVTSSLINDSNTPILRSTLMLPPGTTIKQIPITPNVGSDHETNKTLPNSAANNLQDDAGEEQPPQTQTLRSGTLFYKITKHKKANLAINQERLEIEKNRQKFHELIADKIFAMLVSRGGKSNSDTNDTNLSYCNIKEEI